MLIPHTGVLDFQLIISFEITIRLNTSLNSHHYITEQSAKHVHHMLIYTCNGLEEDDLRQGKSCDKQSRTIDDCRSFGTLLSAWAVGGSDFMYPENVAAPIAGVNGQKFVVLETHYDNPNLVPNIVDGSGFIVTYLDKPRKYDAGIMYFGHVVTYRMAIPPGISNFTATGFCLSNCTEKYIPPEGIKVFAAMLHTHLAGIGVSFSVIRKSGSIEKQARIISQNLKYDFNFQQVTYLPEEIILFPGDELLVNCYYNTTDRDTVTMGGITTRQEMCLAFPVYYPKIEMAACVSRPILNELADFVDLLPANEQRAFHSVLEDGISSTRNAIGLDHVTWNESLANVWERISCVMGDQTSFCLNSTDVDYFRTNIPVISEYHSPPTLVGNCNTGSSATSVIIQTMSIEMFILLLYISFLLV